MAALAAMAISRAHTKDIAGQHLGADLAAVAVHLEASQSTSTIFRRPSRVPSRSPSVLHAAVAGELLFTSFKRLDDLQGV
jgi:hypothetical protein